MKLFSYIFDYHKENDVKFVQKDKEKFMYLMSIYYEKILSWWLEYMEWNDLSITFCKWNIKDIIRKYCSTKTVEEFNKDIYIHPIERKWSINKILFYRSTKQNKFVNKMFDDYPEWKNTKRIAKDFLDYLDKINY